MKCKLEWTQAAPTEQGFYWHWCGDEDASPLPLFVMFSGTSKRCFISLGQFGIQGTPDCAEYGGWWLPIEIPPTPNSTSHPLPELNEAFSVTLFFGNDQDRMEFVKAVKQGKFSTRRYHSQPRINI